MASALDAQPIKDITILDKEDVSNAHRLLKLMLTRDGVTKIKLETGRNTSPSETMPTALVREPQFQNVLLNNPTTHGSIFIPMLLRMCLLQTEVQSMFQHTLLEPWNTLETVLTEKAQVIHAHAILALMPTKTLT